jgi:hypothetical protein
MKEKMEQPENSCGATDAMPARMMVPKPPTVVAPKVNPQTTQQPKAEPGNAAKDS